MIMATLVGQEELSNTPKRTQTFQATHDGAGNSLPLYLRSFLSFSYGGKAIEEFSLIVTYDERIEKGIYSEFEDATSDYTTVDGQYYWGTRMEPLELEFTLSTDYMDQKTMEDFKAWFRPGVERALILSEHPNRYIMARVSEPPEMDMTPFGEEVDVEINGKIYKTMTTIYRGDITLNFVMDYPYWTGILNYMPYLITGNNETNNEQTSTLLEQLKSAESINTLSSKDALKICLEDNIPHGLGLYSKDSAFILGNKDLYTGKITLSRVPGVVKAGVSEENATDEDYIRTDANDPVATWPRVKSSYIQYVPTDGTAITDISSTPNESDSNPTAPFVVNYNVNSIPMNLSQGETKYLFYSGTAPSKPFISFKLQFTFDDNGYINHPVNSVASSPETERSYIKVGKNKFEFTTPGLLTAYNKAIQIVDEIKEEASIFDLKKEFREKIRDKYVRAWAIYSLSKIDAASADNASKKKTDIKNKIKELFTDEYSAEFKFDSKTGTAIGIFNINTIDEEKHPTSEKITENVGDMVLSNYLIINERNILENGIITTEKCTPITTNENLSEFSIVYDNMYY